MLQVFISTTQGNYGFAWQFTCVDSQFNPVSLSGATTLTFELQLQSDSAVQSANAATVVSPASSGVCQYVVQQGDFPVPGTYNAQIKVAYGSGEILTFPGIVITAQPAVPQ
jgi:hypothetical protein